MKDGSSENADTLRVAGGIFFIVFLAWLFSERFAGIDQLLAQFLRFPGTDIAASPLVVSHDFGSCLMRTGIISLFASVGVYTAHKQSTMAGKIVLVQLIALNVVLHVLLASVNFALAIPFTLVVASCTGIAYGSLLRQLSESRTRVESSNMHISLIEQELDLNVIEMIKDDEVERRMLAGDLHDQVLNDLKLIKEKLNQYLAEPSGTGKEEIESLLNKSMQEIREVMDSLSPAVLQHLGFLDAIEVCVRKGAERSQYKVRFRSTVDAKEFESFGAIDLAILYRLVQESVTNICKHAEAKTVKCYVTADGDRLNIAVLDDGNGFDPANSTANSRGLRYMRQRANLIDARLSWEPGEDGKGTRVNISIAKPKQEQSS